MPLHWRHNDYDGVSNHQPHGCLLNRLFRRRSKKTSKFRVTGLCAGNSPGPVNSPHKGPVTRKMFPFEDVIMGWQEVIMDLLFTLASFERLVVVWTINSISPWCRVYTSVKWVSISSGNGLSPFGAKQLHQPMLTYYRIDPYEPLVKFEWKYEICHS